MKVKFIKSTNIYAEELINRDGDLYIGLTASFSFEPIDVSFELRKGIWRTSIIKNIIYTEISMSCYEIEIETNNSSYTFQYGTKSDKKPLNENEKLDMALNLGMGII